MKTSKYILEGVLLTFSDYHHDSRSRIYPESVSLSHINKLRSDIRRRNIKKIYE